MQPTGLRSTSGAAAAAEAGSADSDRYATAPHRSKRFSRTTAAAEADDEVGDGDEGEGEDWGEDEDADINEADVEPSRMLSTVNPKHSSPADTFTDRAPCFSTAVLLAATMATTTGQASEFDSASSSAG
jgi:hypothetical protein